MRRTSSILLVPVALMLGAMAPVPRGIAIGSAAEMAGCCVAPTPESSSSDGCATPSSCGACPSAGEEESSAPATSDDCSACVCCLCGIGIAAAPPDIPELVRSTAEHSQLEVRFVSVDIPPAQLPPEGMGRFS